MEGLQPLSPHEAQEVGVGDALPSRRDAARFVVRLHFPFTVIISLAESD